MAETATGAKQLLALKGDEQLASFICCQDPALVTCAANTIRVLCKHMDQYGTTCWRKLRAPMPEALLNVLHRVDRNEADTVSSNSCAVAACVDAFGALCQAPELSQRIADMKVVQVVLSMLQNTGDITVTCACMRTLGLLWVHVSHNDLETETFLASDAGEWIIGKTMELVHSEHRLLRVAACMCAKELATDETMLVGMVAGGLFDRCMDFLQDGVSFEEQRAAMGVLEMLCRGRPYMAEWCTNTVSAVMFQHLLSDQMCSIEQAARTMAALACTEEGLSLIVREVPHVKKEGIAPIVDVLRNCPAASVQIATSEALHAVATHKRWSFVVCEMAGFKFIEVRVPYTADCALNMTDRMLSSAVGTHVHSSECIQSNEHRSLRNVCFANAAQHLTDDTFADGAKRQGNVCAGGLPSPGRPRTHGREMPQKAKRGWSVPCA